jgi:hypothetical protein
MRRPVLITRASEAVLTASQAHNEAMSLPMPQVIANLVELLGATAVAAIADVKETRAVQQWVTGQREPQRPHVLRFTLQLTLMMCNLTSRELARAWFHGANPVLDDRVPLILLRDRPLEEVQFSLMAAARAFAGHSLA